MFLYNLAHFITKLTAVPVELLFFKRKTYYEDKRQKSRHGKGGLLYVSNHKSFWDYICYFFLVYFHRLRPVVSALMYKKNPVLRFFLHMCGAIVVGEDALDISYIDTCVSYLRKGKKIVIFPEAHFILCDTIQPFSPSFAKIALEADVPIVPLYTDGRYGLFKRTHVAVGRRIEPSEVCVNKSNEEASRLCKLVQRKVEYLQVLTNRRKKTPTLSFRHFPMDFGRILCFLFIYPFFRTSWHALGSIQSAKAFSSPYIIACNHRSFADPVVMILSFYNKRIHILIAKEVFGEEGEHRLRKKALRGIGGIKIDRASLDVEAINACRKVLEEGKALCVFPEGHLTHDQGLSPLKDGTAMIAASTGVPILPLYLCSSKHFLSKKHIYIGDPIYPSSRSMAEVKSISSRIADSFKQLRNIAVKEGKEHE